MRAAWFNPREPSIARVYDWLLGGKNSFPADREEAERLLGIYPPLGNRLRENRLFLASAVTWLARQGIRHFLDLGSGLPTAGNTHQIAQAADPGCQVVYVDNDPMVASHAAALLADGRGVAAAEADLADPAAILAGPQVRQLIPPGQPCAVILAMVLHFFDADTAAGIAADYASRVAAGSYLVVSCGSGDERTGGTLAREYKPAMLRNHPPGQIGRFFAGLELISPPGLVDARAWQPGVPVAPPSAHGGHVLAGIARKQEARP